MLNDKPLNFVFRHQETPPQSLPSFQTQIQDHLGRLIEDSPKHYGNNDLLEFFHNNQVPYLESSAMRYTFRHKKKNGKADILKAIDCLQHILRLEYGVNDSNRPEQLQ